MRGAIACGLFLGLAACNSPSPLDEVMAARAGAASSLVEGPHLKGDIESLASVHQSEAPFDCTLLDTEGLPFPVCNLTRTGTREVIRARLQTLGYQVSAVEQGDAPFTTSNIVAEARGSVHPEEVVLLGAHFDAFFQGADDNTSGLAAMLEVARLAAGKSFSRTLRFVAFDFEEIGWVGSARFVQALPSDERLHAVIILDCIGYTDRTPGSQRSLPGLQMPSTGDFIAVLSSEVSRSRLEEMLAVSRRLETPPPVLGAVLPGDGASALTFDMLRSDHGPFWMKGLTALFVTDTANLRSPHYHKATDLPDTLDYEFLEGVTRLLTGSVFYFAGEVQP